MILFVNFKNKHLILLIIFFLLLLEKSYKTENDLVNNSERKIIDAEHRASIAEQQISKMEEEKKVCFSFHFIKIK